MANQYNFVDGDLQLSADKVTQFTNALTTEEVADPLQELCDEAAADVARLTAGYVVDSVSVFNFIRALVVFKAYSNSGTPVPPDIATSRKDAWSELQSISRGERTNLPKAADPALQSRAGAIGSARRIHGRMSGGFGNGSGGQI
jgi:hypothetical protein